MIIVSPEELSNNGPLFCVFRKRPQFAPLTSMTSSYTRSTG